MGMTIYKIGMFTYMETDVGLADLRDVKELCEF